MENSVAAGLQSPNIFCLSSLRCCASSDKVAVGRASRRPTPIGSPGSPPQPEPPASTRGTRRRGAPAVGLAGLVAVAVVAGIDAGDRLLDLLEQLAFAIAGAQFQGV